MSQPLLPRRVLAPLAFGLLLLAPPPASALDFLDGRLTVHGFYELQLRAMARDFDTADNFDLSQWYNVFNVELEADLAPDGFGPFDLVQAFARVEARYDCVWVRGCGMISSVDSFGDRADRSPKRLADGRRAGYRSSGTVFNGDTRAFRDIPRERLDFKFRDDPDGRLRPSEFFTIQGIDTLFDTVGVDKRFGTEDDPAPFYFERQLAGACLFNYRKTRGSFDGIGTQILGPWGPGCRIRPLAALAEKGHPLSPLDVGAGLAEPVLSASTALPAPLPFRPVPANRADANAPLDQARGLYYPNSALASRIRSGDFDAFDQNFRQAELEWNRGASQQDEKELKEAYLDLEMLDSRLWLRVGKQQIVWGKTELFRNQDQWNPQDLALASLPSLEESRIGLWAARGVWSFYEVGPLEDVRLEMALLFDQFEPTDLGRCGEPYAPNPVCNKTLGLYVHGLTGFGVAGEERPPDPWNSVKGLEAGARVEWRWDRFSFALTEYYGYTDLFYQDEIFRYSRNVDPVSGRPRRNMDEGECRDGTEPACLTAADALTDHSVNQQLFHMICATSIGLLDLDTSACGQSLFNSQRSPLGGAVVDPVTDAAIGSLVSGLLAGNPSATFTAASLAPGAMPSVITSKFVRLNEDPCDGKLDDCVSDADMPGEINERSFFAGIFPSMNGLLTQQQKALLGCGQFYGTNCETAGIDLMNAEASVLLQSFPGTEGTFGVFPEAWDSSASVDPSGDPLDQPGTVGFVGDRGPVGTRTLGDILVQLPGARGPNDPSILEDDDGHGGLPVLRYNPALDGCTGTLTGSNASVFGCNAGDVASFTDASGMTVSAPMRASDAMALLHPLTGQRFASEMAALSWNALMGLVTLSSADDDDNLDGDDDPDTGIEIDIDEFDGANPLRLDGCSFAAPNYCSNVQSIFQVTGVQRNTVNAGGNVRFGRRDWVWQGGRDIALRYEKRNVLGFSLDFAEDRTKSSWGFEFTWQNNLTFADNDSPDGLARGIDTYNLTISVDRPTFINFLNPGRTFFLNTQLFTRYVDGYRKGFTSSGPWTFLGVAIIETGYFDDRLIPRLTMVYDKRSNSGALIHQILYKFSSDFSATFGVALFSGREEQRRMPLSPNSLSDRVGRGAYSDFVENGLSAVRDRDELFLRVRYSF